MTSTLKEKLADDILSPEAIHNPESYFARLREEDPIHWNEKQKMWVVTRYEDVVFICRQPKLFSSDKLGFNVTQIPESKRAKYQEQFPDIFSAYPHILSATDNPVHDQIRLIVNQVWTPVQAEKWRLRIRGLIHRLLDDLENKDEIDFIKDFTLPLPLRVILEFLGFAQEDWKQVKKYSDRWLAFHFGSGLDAERWHSGAEGIKGLIDYVQPRVCDLKSNPQDDYISALFKAEWKGQRLSDQQVIVHCATMLFAGHETTTNLLANGLHILLSNRDQWSRICADPSLIASAVEEIIRLGGSIKSMMRYALDDIEIKGKKIKKGDLVLLVNTSANRDSRKFSCPHQVDVARRPNAHLGFGQGIHICLGAPLARIEAQEAYLALSQRFPAMKLLMKDAEYYPLLRARALKSLPVVLR